ncbi:hypothetical protein PR048_014651 [Dryococelus australis]|uniref:Ribosomal protein L2 n=1 Tax=Dryococelus australis TaxID=614101 RepID=A0ABQ9HET9_9NEOP|nr:hypothetical protein PR048_014651 [Dryococelus australis]
MKGRGKTGYPRENPPTSGIVLARFPHVNIWKRPRKESNPIRLGGIILGRGKQEIPEKTRRPKASSGPISTCENPGSNPAGNRARFASGEVGRRAN